MATQQELLQRLELLEGQVRDLTAIKEIETLHQQYVKDLADRNWAGVANAYAEDAVCDTRNHGRHHGREGIAAMFATDLEDVVKSRDGYVLSSPSITVTGDTAYGEWTWHRFQCEFRTSFGLMRVWGPWSEGIYKCHYERIGGEWKIKDLWFRVIRPDTDEEIAAVVDGQVIGGGFAPVASR